MDSNLNTILNWILTESNAPNSIRKMALDLRLSQNSNQSSNPESKMIDRLTVTKEQYDAIDEQIELRSKIMAIKLLREYTKCSLKDAKDNIERHFGI